MSVKKVASKVEGAASKVKGVIRPLGVALPVAMPNINALFSGGPRAMLDYNVNAIKTWRPPDWNTVTGYVDGPGGAAVMTSIGAGLIKWGVNEAGFSIGGLNMLLDAVKAWGDGSAMGWAFKELLYPTVSGESALFGDVSYGGFGFGGQPAKDSPAEMSTRDRKPKQRSMMQ